MTINAIREYKILAIISEFTEYTHMIPVISMLVESADPDQLTSHCFQN